MEVPLVDLRATLLPIREDLFRQFNQILDGMQLFLGPNAQSFESEFADYCGVEHGIAVSNGTDALFAALRACDVGPGDEVIAPAHTFFATIEAIAHAGATPVLVDVEPDNLTIDVNAAAAAVTSATKAIVPVHLYGHPADMDGIAQVAAEHGLRVIEDAAQAHGALYKGRRCGSLGDAGCFSFYFTKNLGAFGEGGFVTTNNAQVAEQVRLLRHHGQTSKFDHTLMGHNLRMDELQATVLRLKLPHLEADNQRRRQVALAYDERLGGLDVRVQSPDRDALPVYHVYTVRVKERDGLRDHLTAHGIGTGIHYKVPGHRQPALRRHPHRAGPMPVTEQVCDRILSIPMYPQMTDDQVAYVADHVVAFVGHGSG